MIAAGGELGGIARQVYAQRVGDGIPGAEVDDQPLVAVAVVLRFAIAQTGGDVAGQRLTLTDGVLGGGRGDLARLGQVRNGRRVLELSEPVATR